MYSVLFESTAGCNAGGGNYISFVSFASEAHEKAKNIFSSFSTGSAFQTERSK